MPRRWLRALRLQDAVAADLAPTLLRAADVIQALVEHRKTQQGAAPRIIRVPPAMDIDAAVRWRDDVLRAEDVPVDERPHYLLILGDLHEVSLELQQVLAGDALVGRLQCPTLKGFRDYAEKVVAREKAEPVAAGRALFYTVQDGTAAMSWGPERIDVFARGADNALWHKFYEEKWSDWESLGGELTSALAVATWGPGRLHVFCRGADNGLHHLDYFGFWRPWAAHGGFLASAPAVAAWDNKRLDVFVRGGDNALWQRSWDGDR